MSKQLYAVIYTIGGYAREDASVPGIAGIYTDPEIAEYVRKAVSCFGSKVVPIDLDFIHPGHADHAKQLFGIDLFEKQEILKAKMVDIPEKDMNFLMTVEDFEDAEKANAILPSDGCGFWATEKQMSQKISCFAQKPKWATHVVWYNN